MPSSPIRFISLAALAIGLWSSAAAGQETYFLSPDGDDGHAGTKAAPWATLEKAARTARAGDEVRLLSGTYRGSLRPAHSGTADAPIAFRSADGQTAVLEGGHDGDYAVSLTDVAHIRVENLEIRPRPADTGRWLEIRNSSHLRLKGLLMENSVNAGTLGQVPLAITESEHIQLRNSIVRNRVGGDMIHIYNSSHLLFEANAISHAGHSPMAFSPRQRLFKGVDHVVMRGNVFHAGWGRPFEFFSEPKVLFENNIVTHAYHGRLSAGPEAKIMLEESIVRFNRVYRNWGSALNMGYYNKELSNARDTYYYNNVFDDNYDRAMRIETVEDYIFKNNIFSRNDPHGGGRQLVFGSERSGFVFTSNNFWAGAGNETMIDAGTGTLLTLETVGSEMWRGETRSRRDNLFDDTNTNRAPGYVDAARYDHALATGSRLRDAGQPLTRTAGSGSGTILAVEDVGYFFDGFGIEGEQGDVIAVGSSQQKARVDSVDRPGNRLFLDRSLRWSDGAPVSLPWTGAAPDMGVYEHGAKGHVSVQIATDPYVAAPGEDVTLHAVLRGDAEPVKYSWRVGIEPLDAEGSTITHRFEDPDRPSYSPGGYPVYCRVTTESGDTYLGVGYVEVQPTRWRDRPLAHLTFDADPFDPATKIDAEDGQWWWFWYHNRPTVDQKLVFEEDGNGVLHFSAPEGEHVMGVRAWPGQWNIDNHPMIRFRYRIDEGLPLGLYVQAFDDGIKERRIYVALAARTRPPTGEVVGDPAVLEDDGAWHTITLDARDIREVYPDVQVLEKIRFEAVEPSRVEAGDGFWLDDFYIAPPDQ